MFINPHSVIDIWHSHLSISHPSDYFVNYFSSADHSTNLLLSKFITNISFDYEYLIELFTQGLNKSYCFYPSVQVAAVQILTSIANHLQYRLSLTSTVVNLSVSTEDTASSFPASRTSPSLHKVPRDLVLQTGISKGFHQPLKVGLVYNEI